MKKLSLNKQKVMFLSASELNNINGGGIKRSNRLSGGCHYSRNNEFREPCQSGGQNHVTGCTARIAAGI